MKNIKILLTLCVLVLMFVNISNLASAQTTDISISIDKEKIGLGDIFELTITFNTQQPIGLLNADIIFDNNLINFHSGGGNATQISNGLGAIRETIQNPGIYTLSYSFTFTAIDSGIANFEITQSELSDFNTGALIGTPTQKISISIGSPKDGNIEPTPPTEPIDNSKDRAIVYLGASVTVLRQMPVDLPSGYELTTLKLQGEEFEIAVNSNNGITLINILEADEPVLFIYHRLTNTLFPFIQLDIGEGYTILPIHESFQGFTLTDLELVGRMIPALKSDIYSNLYLLKAINSHGDTGFYIYDTDNGSMVSVSINEINNIDEIQESAKSSNAIIITLLTMYAILLTIVIYMTYKLKKIKTKTRSRGNIHD